MQSMCTFPGRVSALLIALFLHIGARAADPAPPVAWQGTVDVASGAGERGPWEQNRSRYDYVDDPAVAIDAAGEAGVAWVDQGRKRVLFQRFGVDGKGRFERPVAVSRSPQVFSWLPKLVFGEDSAQIYVVWQDIIFSGGSHGGDILFARSEDGGASFSDPINLSRSVSGAGKGRITRERWHNGSYDLAVGSDGAIHVAWTEFEGRLLLVRSTDGGMHFTSPRVLAGGDAAPARGPSLAAGDNGSLYLAWTMGGQEAADIHVAYSDSGGVHFDRTQIAAQTAGYSDAPQLALHDGVLHLAYAESVAGPFDRFHIHYTRSTDQARSFEAPRAISTPSPVPGSSAHFPHLALDGAGDPVVTWELQPRPAARPRGLGIAISRDGGRHFSKPAPVPASADPAGGANGSYQGLLMQKLAVNADGALVLVNSSLRENAGSRVWMIRGQLTDDADGG